MRGVHDWSSHKVREFAIKQAFRLEWTTPRDGHRGGGGDMGAGAAAESLTLTTFGLLGLIELARRSARGGFNSSQRRRRLQGGVAETGGGTEPLAGAG